MTPQHTSQSEQHSRRQELEAAFEIMLESYENRREGTSERIQETLSVAKELDATDIIAHTLLLKAQYNISTTEPTSYDRISKTYKISSTRITTSIKSKQIGSGQLFIM